LPSLAAIANAVEDALAPFGVKVTSLPITPEKVVRAVTESKLIQLGTKRMFSNKFEYFAPR
ncbi:MAG: hypothetical protein HYY82_04640, partial [Deltaproteobacteria bacterium]|nr:hypothetical protein [Deltaproteobacteria bacterium]